MLIVVSYDHHKCCHDHIKCFKYLISFVFYCFREQLVEGKKGRVLQNFLVATDGVQLTPAENVALVQCVEQETLALAKNNGFSCIFTSNSSPLTQVDSKLI